MESAHLAIDGSTVTIDAVTHEQSFHPSSVGVYEIDGRWSEFTASYRNFGRDVAADLGVTPAESYKFQDGTLLLGTASVTFPDPRPGVTQTDLLHLGVWEGRRYSVHAHRYNGQVHELIELFDRFDVVEQDLGIRLVAKDPEQTFLAREPSVLREVPRVGLVQVRPLTRQLARNLPAWRGAAVRGGELFVGRRPGSLHMVLIGSRSRTLIMRDGEACGKEDMAHVVSLNVDWQPLAGTP